MIIKDPLYGFIKFSKLAKKIVDCEEFQRLRYIKQLGVCHYVYPSANHNRFEHSLGVYHLTKIFINNLKENSEDIDFNERHLELICIAALIHDIGHVCLSHMFDNILEKLNICKELENHENRSILLINHINNKYNLKMNKDELFLIEKIVKGEKIEEYPEWYFEIVANHKNSIDTDKIDYLLRDSYHIGLNVNFDYRYLINNVKIINNKLCYNEKISYTIYSLFLQRFKLHKEVYKNKKVLCINSMISDIILKSKDFLNITKIFTNNSLEWLKITDDILNYIKYNCKNEEIQNIFKRLNNRDLYKFLNDIDKTKINQKNILKKNIVLSLSSLSNNDNPFKKILFFKSSNKNDYFSMNIKDISKTISNNFFDITEYYIVK